MSPVDTRRILIALSPDTSGATDLEPVFKIARRSQAMIEGICIEDLRLLDIAGLPRSRFIHAYSREATTLDEPTARRAMRVAAARARENFETVLTRTSISWSFRTRQCAVFSEAFSDAAPGDLLVVPLLRGAANASHVRTLVDAVSTSIDASLLILNETGTPDRSVLAVFDGDLEDLAAASNLAMDFACPLRVLVVGETEEAALARTRTADTFLQDKSQPIAMRTVAPIDDETLYEAIAEAAPGTLVLDRSGESIRKLDVTSLLARTSSSLLLRN